MPIDAIKVDHSFVAKLIDRPSSREIMKAVIGLAHALRMGVVAEGVDTARHHEELTQLGADFCQGFYFAKPMLSTLVDTLIRAQADGSRVRLPVTDERLPVLAEQGT